MPTFYDQFVACEEHWPQNVALEIQRHDQVESYNHNHRSSARRDRTELAIFRLKTQQLADGTAHLLFVSGWP